MLRILGEQTYEETVFLPPSPFGMGCSGQNQQRRQFGISLSMIQYIYICIYIYIAQIECILELGMQRTIAGASQQLSPYLSVYASTMLIQDS